jgi:tetratricopeptide (TPR) repeat protein
MRLRSPTTIALAAACAVIACVGLVIWLIQVSVNPTSTATIVGSEIAAVTSGVTLLTGLGRWWRKRVREGHGLDELAAALELAKTGEAGASLARSPATVSALSELPGDTEYFTGRTKELSRIGEGRVNRGNIRGSPVAYAIIGMAGIGKTRLVVHLAHDLKPHYPDGQVCLNLHAHSTERAPVELAEALETLLSEFGTPPQRIQQMSRDKRLREWQNILADRRVLLILDNARDSEQVAPLLCGGPESLVLITSRTALVNLIGVPLITLDAFSPAEAVELLTKIVGPDRIAGQVRAAKRVAENCGHLPLAIEIAGRKLLEHKDWDIARLAEELDRVRGRLDRFQGEDDNKVLTAFALSYEDLQADIQRIFRYLGLHPGPIVTAYDAAALADCPLSDAERMLAQLHRLHLIAELPQGRNYYQLHDLLREYAAYLVVKHDRARLRDKAIKRLLDAYLYTSSVANKQLRCISHRPLSESYRPRDVPQIAGFEEANAWMDSVWKNLMYCASHARDVGRKPHAWLIPEMLGYFFRIRGHLREALDVHSSALDAARDAKDRLGEAAALCNLGIIDRLTGDAPSAHDKLQDALATYQASRDRLGEAETLRALGVLNRLTGEYRQAKICLEGALSIHRELPNQLGEAWVLGAQGVLRRLTGEYSDAYDRFDEALSICRGLKDRLGEAWMLTELGSLDRLEGDYDSARERLFAAIPAYVELGDQFSRAWTLCQVAMIYRLTGDYLGARRELNTALRVFRRLRSKFAEARALCELGVLDRLQGEYLAARQKLDQALAIYQKLGDSLGEVRTQCELTVLERLTSDRGNTSAHMDRGVALHRDLGDRLGEAWTLSALGAADRLSGNYPSSYSRLDVMLINFRELGNPLGKAWTLSSLGVLSRLIGDYATARSQLGDALTAHRELGNPPGEAWTLSALGIADRLDGNDPDAALHLQRALAIYHELGNRLGEAWTLCELAMLDTVADNTESAEARLQSSLHIYDYLGDQFGRADTLLKMGELSRRIGQTATSQVQRKQALDIFEKLGLTAHAAYARSLLS